MEKTHNYIKSRKAIIGEYVVGSYTTILSTLGACVTYRRLADEFKTKKDILKKFKEWRKYKKLKDNGLFRQPIFSIQNGTSRFAGQYAAQFSWVNESCFSFYSDFILVIMAKAKNIIPSTSDDRASQVIIMDESYSFICQYDISYFRVDFYLGKVLRILSYAENISIIIA